MAAYTLCLQCTASNFDIEMLTSTQQLEIMCDPNNGYLHFVLVTQWVQFWSWNLTSKVAACTFCWCRTGSNFDNSFWTQHCLPTIGAGVASSLIFVWDFEFNGGYLHVVLASHWIQTWCWNLYQNSSYLHLVLTSNLVGFRYWHFNQQMSNYTLFWCRTALKFDSGV